MPVLWDSSIAGMGAVPDLYRRMISLVIVL